MVTKEVGKVEFSIFLKTPIMFPESTFPVQSITTEQMIEVDRAMIEDFEIKLEQMMENAGRNLAHLARMRFLSGNPVGKRVAVLAGSGGNGGGVMVAARRLHNWGAEVEVFLTRAVENLTPVPAWQSRILTNKKVPVYPESIPTSEYELILDGVIGYSLSGDPRGVARDMIHWINDQSVPVLSLDTPSGIGLTTGQIYDPVVNATATMTLALPKAGLLTPTTSPLVGELYLADISVPPELYQIPSLGIDLGPIFAESEILRIKNID